MLTHSQKKYLFAIYKLSQNGKPVKSAEVAKIVGVSKASTVKMTQRLIEDGYIIKEPYMEISLTEKGIREANELYTPSLILCDFLSRTAGVSKSNSDSDSVAMVSHMSEESVEKLVKFVLEYNMKNKTD
ncbi:metal-dependent transcriptional regulator [Porcipelethomonas sp.]|uniref:metal-dependent transcriptional regulator n=1 Tax=Porcipelethomonas sp. TaxID=2981675 RepID=UPI003EF0A2B9